MEDLFTLKLSVRPTTIMTLTLIVIIGFLTLYPLAILICGSFSPELGRCGNFSLAKYVDVYSNPRINKAIMNTLTFALGSATLSTLLAMVAGWLTVRTNMPFRKTFEIIAIVPILLPVVLVSIAWTLLLNPVNGLMNVLIKSALGLSSSPFNIYSMYGMIFVEGLIEFPLAFLIITAALRSIDPSLEEMARLSGAKNLRVALGITFVLIRPAILSSWILNFLRAIESFQVPGILAIPARIQVITTLIRSYVQVVIPPDHGLAAALSTILLAITVTALVIYWITTRHQERYATLRGGSLRTPIVDLGRLKWGATTLAILLLTLTLLLPISILLISSLTPYIHVPTWKTIHLFTLSNYIELFTDARSLKVISNSVFLAVLGATLGMTLASLISYLTIRTKVFGRGLLELLAFLPFSFPGIVFAVALLWAYVGTPLYYTIWILLIAYITRFLPFGIRSTSSTIVQIHKELEEVSKICGANFLRTFKEIILPLLKPGFMAGWIILATIFMREVSASILLYTSSTEVIGVYIFSLYEDGRSNVVAALGILIVGITLALVIVSQKLTGIKIRRRPQVI